MKLAWHSLLVCTLLLGLPLAGNAQNGSKSAKQPTQLFGHATLQGAWQTAIANKKPLLVMFTSDHCIYCQKMITETYGHPVVKQTLATHTESVLAHANDYSELVKRMGIRGFPTSLLISPQGQVLDVMEGFVEPRTFAQRINPHLVNKAYQQNFATQASHQPVGQ